ncbi:amidotransferase 1, exosortase A system-associated [Rhodoferax sp. 4810]|uniref:asparagine synthase (glutamine-hydrolyzing) n=1 Tax=Thiospirillum jenense TaxID=1653858 RepID=A0A839H471_9GAMM|nr:XrtA/PEP-CTERM system amidotransferase [Thiospirillum jenense]MBB1073158.1 amidotransferase 1, exosortase A system-associated [Rhodoferax jenense]MBB1124681.1 amidotransferase 1, exosortase A system-associated [Thiospirillum jenense]
MCGLAGIFDTREQRPIDPDLLTRMNDALWHRGPDAGGEHREPGLGLSHRRLAIIDLSGGAQPLFNEDHSVVVVFNGEIYNFQTLATELTAAGHIFRTHCDTEVIVHAWEQWGERCVDRFRGMFAFALWDRQQQTLFLARDRLGVKPLHYALLADGRLLFASEMKSLLLDSKLPRDLDPHAIEEYFAYGYIPDPRSIFKSIHKLPAGHTLTIRRGQSLPAPREYWDILFQPSSNKLDIQTAADELIERLRESIRIRLISEVPLGAFLSGGVDSSAVVAMMAGLSDQAVNTCSIGFNDPKYNESAFAELVANRYHTNHHLDTVSPDDFNLIGQLATLYDEPYADSSAMPTYRVCELARRRVTVCLSGDGGDETFAGYRRYRWHMYEDKVRRLIPQWLRGPVFGAAGFIYPKADWAPQILRAKSTLQALARTSIDGYFDSIAILNNSLRAALFSPQLRRELQGYQAVEVLRHYAKRAPDHPVSRAQYLDLKTYLPGDILTKVDRASMAHALEVREPLLDHPLLEWAATLPPEWQLNGREGKFLFKKSLEPYLDNDNLYRPKMGFAVPLAAWFRGPLREQLRTVVLGDTIADTSLFNMKRLRWMVDQHQAGIRDFSPALWSLLMFGAFQNNLLSNTPSD